MRVGWIGWAELIAELICDTAWNGWSTWLILMADLELKWLIYIKKAGRSGWYLQKSTDLADQPIVLAYLMMADLELFSLCGDLHKKNWLIYLKKLRVGWPGWSAKCWLISLFITRFWHTQRVTVTICGDACPLSCASAEAYKLAQCTRPQGCGS